VSVRIIFFFFHKFRTVPACTVAAILNRTNLQQMYGVWHVNLLLG